MRCAICDSTINEAKWNPELGEFEPCDTCMDVVEDTLAGFTDKPSAAEDELGHDPYLEDLLWSLYRGEDPLDPVEAP